MLWAKAVIPVVLKVLIFKSEEVSQYNIKVILVIPFAIDSKFVQKELVKSDPALKDYITKRFLSEKQKIHPDSLADLIVKLIETGEDIKYVEIIVKP